MDEDRNSCYLDASKFYGKNSECERLKKCHKDLQGILPFEYDFKSSLEGPTVTWKVFKRQQEALEYMRTHTKDGKTFAFEQRIPGGDGKRIYLVTHPKNLWQVHKRRLPEDRCTYEVIAKDAPCKLYLDLEFNKINNLAKNGPEMVETIIKCLCIGLKEKYDINCDKSQILWLDASTDTKFSCHLIFQLNGFCFLNNIEVGKFVHYVCSDILNENSSLCSKFITSDKLSELTVQNKDGTNTLFCDLGVYTKNRNFRLYLSTKFHKNAPLVLATKNCYKCSKSDTEDWEEDIFLDSLITYFRSKDSLRYLTFDDVTETEVKSFCNDRLCLSSESLHGYENSPYPEVDDFIQRLVEKSTTRPGYIRHWSYFPDKEQLIYDIGNYRYCENIGRHHKSNHIMIIANLREGVYYQKCYDPDCRSKGFRSKVRKLPAEVLPSYFVQDSFDIEEDIVTENDKKQLLEAMSILEMSFNGNTENHF